MTSTETLDPGQAFAELMSGAAQAAQPEVDPEAPYGWTTDPVTKERRPKKAPGRPRKSPTLDELKSERETQPDGEAPEPEADRAPDARKSRSKRKTKPAADDVAYQPGRIALGMNKLYRQAGRIIAIKDPELGEVFIEVTRKEDDADITVGQAWEELARTNPRIRAFLTRLISGGAWGQLAMAHAPILLVVLMKPWMMNHLPLGRVAAAFFGSDDDGQDDGGGPAQNGAGPGQAPGGDPFAGFQPGDMEQMMGFAQGIATQLMNPAGRAPGAAPPPRPPGGTGPRPQPKRNSRSHRKGR